MLNFNWREIGLSHPPCQNLVDVPTIRVQDRGHGYPDPPAEFAGQKEVVLQWYTQLTHHEELDGFNLQFAFPLRIRPLDVELMGHPEWFKVAMVGALSLWPKKEVMQEIIRTSDLTMESLLVYMMTDKIKVGNGKGGCTDHALLVEVAMLGDPAFGVIRPRVFEDWGVSAELY